MLVLEVVALFLLRIGIPILLLVLLGHLIDRWQRKQLDKYSEPAQSVPPQVVKSVDASRPEKPNRPKAA